MKKIFKSRVFWCLVTALVVGTISVSAATYFPSNDVTYDNKTSGLKSTDVQGAIDELYNTCSSSMISGEYIYYTSNNSEADPRVGSTGYLERRDLNGDNVVTLVSVTGGYTIDSIYIIEDYIYYAVNDAERSKKSAYVARITLDGKNNTTLFVQNAGYTIASVYVTSDYIYYTSNNPGVDERVGSDAYLERRDLNGNNAVTLLTQDAGYSIDSMFIR